jgi:hypothetical protein
MILKHKKKQLTLGLFRFESTGIILCTSWLADGLEVMKLGLISKFLSIMFGDAEVLW